MKNRYYVLSFLRYRRDLNDYVKVSKRYQLYVIALFAYAYLCTKRVLDCPETILYKSIDNDDGTGQMIPLRHHYWWKINKGNDEE